MKIYSTNTTPRVRIPVALTIADSKICQLSEALQAKIGTLSLEAQTKLEKDTAKKEAKAEAKADAALKKKMASQVCLTLLSLNSLLHSSLSALSCTKVLMVLQSL